MALRILEGSELILSAAPDGYDGYEQVVVTGKWKGHWQGDFQVTRAMLQQMRDAGNSRKIATPVDYGHSTIFESSSDAGGWIEPGSFDLRKTGLYAKIDFTEKARAKIAARELRYKSPTIIWNTTDRKTGRMGGASLHSVALTNTPFLHELPEVRLNAIMTALDRVAREDPMNDEQLKKLAILLGLSDDATAEQVIEAAASHATGLTKLLEAIGSEDISGATTKATTLATQATVATGATERIAALEAIVKANTEAESDRNATALVRQAQTDRKVSGDETENYKLSLDHAKRDPAGFTALMASLPAWVPGKADVKPVPPTATGLSASQREINVKLGLSDEDFIKYSA